MVKIEIREVPLKDITPTLDNPRVFKPNDPKMQELIDSVAAQGVVCPVLVRPSGKGYELRAGERRYRAATAAGLSTIPAVIREMSDDEAFNVTMTENMARQDLTPLEEARGINKYIEHGKTIAEVAETLGRSTKYVAQRAQIVRLHPKWMECLTGENPQHDISRWSVPMLTVIARMPEHVQAAAFKKMTGQWETDLELFTSVEQINRRLADCLLSLKLAQFPTDKAFAGCYACTECKKRSSYSPDLFDDLDGDDDADDRCLDRSCWEAKVGTLIGKAYEGAKAKHGGDLLACSTVYCIKEDTEKFLSEAIPGVEVLTASKYRKVKKSEKGARPAIVVHGDINLLKVIYIAKEPSAGQSGGGASGSSPKTLDEKIEQNHKLRRRLMVNYLIEALDRVPGVDITEKKLLSMTLAFGLPYSKTSGYTWNDDWTKINDWMATADGDFSDLVCAQLKPHIFEMIEKRLKSYMDEPYWEEVKAVAALLKIPMKPLAERAAEDKPYPKSWKIERDGWENGEGWR